MRTNVTLMHVPFYLEGQDPQVQIAEALWKLTKTFGRIDTYLDRIDDSLFELAKDYKKVNEL